MMPPYDRGSAVVVKDIWDVKNQASNGGRMMCLCVRFWVAGNEAALLGVSQKSLLEGVLWLWAFEVGPNLLSSPCMIA
jgi:hypothetical protein